jgi:hypothetical protein
MVKIVQLQAPFERLKIYNDISPEVALRKAIILQAIKDATSSSKSKIDKENKIIAREWLYGNDPYFVTICEEAGYEPSYVRSIASEFIKLLNGEEDFKNFIKEFKESKTTTKYNVMEEEYT